MSSTDADVGPVGDVLTDADVGAGVGNYSWVLCEFY